MNNLVPTSGVIVAGIVDRLGGLSKEARCDRCNAVVFLAPSSVVVLESGGIDEVLCVRCAPAVLSEAPAVTIMSTTDAAIAIVRGHIPEEGQEEGQNESPSL